MGEKKKWNREEGIKEEVTKAESGIEETVERDNERRKRIIRKGRNTRECVRKRQR